MNENMYPADALRAAHRHGTNEGLELAAREAEMCGRVLKGVDPSSAQIIAEAIRSLFKPEIRPEYYSKGSSGTQYNSARDPEVTCGSCHKTFLCDAMDASCRMCGERFSKKSKQDPSAVNTSVPCICDRERNPMCRNHGIQAKQEGKTDG